MQEAPSMFDPYIVSGATQPSDGWSFFVIAVAMAIGDGRTMNVGGARYHQPFTTLTIAVQDG
jgi:hypothetical protein